MLDFRFWVIIPSLSFSDGLRLFSSTPCMKASVILVTVDLDLIVRLAMQTSVCLKFKVSKIENHEDFHQPEQTEQS